MSSAEKRCDAIPCEPSMKIVLGLAGLVLAVFLVDRLLLWME